MIAIAINGALSGDGKPIETVSINQCREILASLSLYASLLDIEILYALTSTQHGSTLQIEMGSFPEVEASAGEGPCRYHYYAPTLLSSLVDNCLNCLRLHQRTVSGHAVLRDDITFPQR